MLVASRVTSGPMPSPARTAILRRMRCFPFLLLVRCDRRFVWLQQTEKVQVVDVLLAVSQLGEAVIDLIQLFTGERVTELFEALCQSTAPAVLAENEVGAG